MTPGLFESLLSPPDLAGRLRTWEDGGWVDSPWVEIVRDAHAMATGLRELGVERGRPVAAVITNSAASVRGVLAVWLAGGTVASLPSQARGMSSSDYGEQLLAIQERLEAPALLTAESLVDSLPANLSRDTPVHAWESLAHAGRIQADPPGDDEIAFIQYSSGSTSTPKGCMITSGAIMRQLEVLYEVYDSCPGDRATMCSWLPLSHDMGMFGCLLMSWSAGFDLWLSSPERFVMQPRSWFGDLADSRAQITVSPNMGLDVAVRAASKAGRLPGDLSGLRALAIGGERVEWRTLRSAAATFEPCGLRTDMLGPGYGLAEATLGVASVAVGVEPSMVSLDGAALGDGRVEEVPAEHPHATQVVSCGPPRTGCAVQAPEEGLSPIRVSSVSLAEGYHRDPDETARRFRDGWLDTNDLGFVREGELYVVGRSDDVLTIGARKVYATEIESAVGALDAVRTGCCTVVDLRDSGRARLAMLIELNGAGAEATAVAREASRISMRRAGVTVHECLIVERGALPKTPSGKVQRFRTRQLIETGSLQPVTRVELRAG